MKKKIVKNRFKEMFVLRNISEKRFGLKLQNEGTITYRSLQRNLSMEVMKESILIRCAELLDCHPAYLEGNINRIWDGDKEEEPRPLLDSKGILIPPFKEYLMDLGWDSNVELFKKWVSAMDIIAYSKTEKGKVYTVSDLIKHRLEFPEIYDESMVYDDLMEACASLIHDFISFEFNDEDEEGE